ncbi:MAG: ABC transporter permease [Patescibacteria group bacterium]
MPLEKLFISYYTIVRKGMVRVVRIWPQTILPSLVTSVLYFTVFGTILGSQIGDINGYTYMQFVVPGLVMLAIITNAFTDVATTFFVSKFFARSIDEILVSPTPPWVIIAGFVSAGIFRSAIVGVAVLIVSMVFALPHLAHPLVILYFFLLSSIIFALGGLINGIYAKNFDGITIIPTFVLTPLVYLGGVFYSAHSLPPLFQTLTYLNPVFYLINGFRYGFLGFSDVSLWTASAVLLALTAIFIVIALYLLKTGLGLKL